jgi:hypothetical protein
VAQLSLRGAGGSATLLTTAWCVAKAALFACAYRQACA